MSQVSMTESAVTHVTNYIARRGKGLGIRVGVKTSGCSGMSYVLEFIDDPVAIDDADAVYDYGTIKLVVDPKSMIYLSGTQLDYVKKGLNEGFEFVNPNVSSECGCGESWNV